MTVYRTFTVQIVEQAGGREQTVLRYSALGAEFVTTSHEMVGSMFSRSGVPVEHMTTCRLDWSMLRKWGRVRTGVLTEEAQGWPMLCFRWYSVGPKKYGALQLRGGRRL